MKALHVWLAIVVNAILMGGCSYSYVSDDGTQHTVGLVKIAVQPPPGDASAGSIVEVATLGIAGYRTPLLSGFSIGYNRERLMSLRNNVLVIEKWTADAWSPAIQ